VKIKHTRETSVQKLEAEGLENQIFCTIAPSFNMYELHAKHQSDQRL
jgi:hypothetical protein